MEEQQKILLTRENYFDVGDERNLVISNTALGYLNPNQGGTFTRFKNFLSKKSEKEESLSLERGKLLHRYIENKDEFYFETENRPSDTICDIIEKFRERTAEKPDALITEDSARQIILAICAEVNYGQSWSEAVRINKVVEQGTAYYNYLVANNGKHMVKADTKEILLQMITSVEGSPQRNFIIDMKPSEQATPYEAFLLGERYFFKRELPIAFELDSIKCKSMIDILHIDFASKEITIRDLKTTSKPVSTFMGTAAFIPQGPGGAEPMMDHRPGAFHNYHYYRQMAFYLEAVRSLLPKDTFVPDQWRFGIMMDVVESIEPYEMISYSVPQKWCMAGLSEVKGIMQLVKEYIKREKLDDNW